MLHRLCTALAEEWGVDGDFSTGVAGVWTIPLGDGLEVVLTEMSGGYHMTAALAKAPSSGREKLFSLLMAGNFVGEETHGAVISLDEHDTVVLSRMVSHVTRPREFQEVLEDFIESADRWTAITLAAAG